jgi:hypothetical protein
MKNFMSVKPRQSKPLSGKWLISGFMAGYLLASLLFSFFRPQVHHFIDAIL